jgi:hypothetical protein
VSQRPVDHRGGKVGNVRAAIDGGGLLLGWNGTPPKSYKKTYYLARRSLGGTPTG